jgi:serine protease Do
LSAYANDLKGGIILSIGTIKAVDIETVSKALSNLDDNQAVQIEMLTVNGQVIRLIYIKYHLTLVLEKPI